MRWLPLFALVFAITACEKPGMAPMLPPDELGTPPRVDTPDDEKIAEVTGGLGLTVTEPLPPPPPPPAGCEEGAPACDPACTVTTTRAALWVTQYDVGNTFGVGEHQGLGLLVHEYVTDPRFGAEPDVPWRHEGELWSLGMAVDEAAQFRMRTLNPGGETTDDEPASLPSVIDEQRLCALNTRLDERLYNHGRTLAERVPDDGYYEDRGLIPIRLIAADVRTGDGAMLRCLEVIEDGYCDAVCGNCSYTADLANGNSDFDVDEPGGQLPEEALPFGSSPAPEPCAEDPDTATVESDRVCGRTPFTLVEGDREVHYVGGSVWGPGDDDEEDGVAWESETPDGWPDPFTHCYDPASSFPQQAPLGVIPFRMITGKWGHNSNTDAEAQLRHFLGCAQDPVAAAEAAWFNADADGSPCSACGVPSSSTGKPAQSPCIDGTNTASLGWGYDSWVDARGVGTSTSTVGVHNIGDLEVGKHNGVDRTDPGFGEAQTWADLPKPTCSANGQPVFGM
jgi:hypothetical protein